VGCGLPLIALFPAGWQISLVRMLQRKSWHGQPLSLTSCPAHLPPASDYMVPVVIATIRLVAIHPDPIHRYHLDICRRMHSPSNECYPTINESVWIWQKMPIRQSTLCHTVTTRIYACQNHQCRLTSFTRSYYNEHRAQSVCRLGLWQAANPSPVKNGSCHLVHVAVGQAWALATSIC
jgi:hypothetical protein